MFSTFEEALRIISDETLFGDCFAALREGQLESIELYEQYCEMYQTRLIDEESDELEEDGYL